MWIPSSYNTSAETSDRFSLGYFRNFLDNSLEFSLETYYKNLLHLVDYMKGARLILNSNMESQLIYGRGRAYGLELMIRKRHGRLNGWIGYTLARTERNGNHMPAYHRLDPGNTVFIELQNIDQGTYNFFRTLGDGIEGLTFLSASPSNPISNISGSGLGYFSAYSVIENYIVIQSNGTYKK